MDLLDALGLSREQAVLVAAGGLLAALLLAGNALFRRSRAEAKVGRALDDR